MPVMKASVAAASPDAYVAALAGWQADTVRRLRRAVLAAAPFEERIKWRHLVYFSNGPVLLVRAEASRVLFGFWRGQRLRDLEPRLKPGGKYEMATIELHDHDRFTAAQATRLARAAVALNAELGDPTDLG